VVTEAHIFQIAEPTRLLTADESGNKGMDIFEASTAQKKKPEDQATKLHELVEPAAQMMPGPPPAIPTEPSPTALLPESRGRPTACLGSESLAARR
jgi:hypothetical protein